MQPSVSIIMPSLNVVDYIEESVLSAINQTMDAIEILFIDAGSTDGTVKILERYAKSEKNGKLVRLIHSKKKSYGYQVNLGIREAKGDYILILETDDYIDQSMAEKQYRVAVECDADMVRSDFVSFYRSNGDWISETPYHIFNKHQDYGVVDNHSDNVQLFIRDQNVWKGIYRREFLLNNNILFNESEGAAYQDLGFILQCLASDAKIVYTDDLFYHYRVNRPGASSKSMNCLKNAYQEFERFTNNREAYDNLVNAPGFYYRMMQTFVGEYIKVLKYCNYNIESECLKPYYAYFKDNLEKYFDFGNNDLSGVEGLCFDECRKLLNDSKDFAKRKCCEDKIKAEHKESFLRKILPHSVYIWGAGKRGKAALDFLISNSVFVKGFIDNNNELKGQAIKGHMIFSIDDVLNDITDNELYIVIANKYNGNEIMLQAVSCGIEESHIVIYE